MRLVTLLIYDAPFHSEREARFRSLIMKNPNLAWAKSVGYAEAASGMQSCHPYLVWIDLVDYKSEEGLAVIPLIKTRVPPPYIILTSSISNASAVLTARHLGVTDFLAEENLEKELEDAISRSVSSREATK